MGGNGMSHAFEKAVVRLAEALIGEEEADRGKSNPITTKEAVERIERVADILMVGQEPKTKPSMPRHILPGDMTNGPES